MSFIGLEGKMHCWRHTNTKANCVIVFSFLEERASRDDRDQNIKACLNISRIKARPTSTLGGKVAEDMLPK